MIFLGLTNNFICYSTWSNRYFFSFFAAPQMHICWFIDWKTPQGTQVRTKNWIKHSLFYFLLTRFFVVFLSWTKCVFLLWVVSVMSPEYLSVEDFPEHIKSLVQKEKESEEQEKRQREIERNTCKVHSLSGKTQFLLPFWSLKQALYLISSVFVHFQIKLFCMHPVKMMMESKLEVHKDKTLREATEMAYKVMLLHPWVLKIQCF